MQIVDTSLIKLDPKNYRRHNKKNKELIAKSLTECGAGRSVLIDKEGALIAGNGVYEQAKKLNIPTKIIETDGSELIVVQRKDLATKDLKRKKLAVMDNSASDSSEFDLEVMKTDFTVEEIKSMGVQDPSLEIEQEKEIEEVSVPIAADPRTKPGDIWQLGKHRLICGDSTKPETLKRLMGDTLADLLLTDPPYNVDYEGSNGKKIQNDKMSPAQFAAFLQEAFNTAAGQLKAGGSFYIWHADTETVAFRLACRGAGLSVRQCLIWNKNSLVLGRQDYKWKHEPCLYGWKEGAGHYFIEEFSHTTVNDENPASFDFSKMSKDDMRALLEKIYNMPSTVINENKPARNAEHPTMKPLKLLARLIRNSSKPGQVVLDSFGGSGSTLVTCEQMDRVCFTAELDPVYCDVILTRWENLTGEKAVRLTGGKNGL